MPRVGNVDDSPPVPVVIHTVLAVLKPLAPRCPVAVRIQTINATVPIVVRPVAAVLASTGGGCPAVRIEAIDSTVTIVVSPIGAIRLRYGALRSTNTSWIFAIHQHVPIVVQPVGAVLLERVRKAVPSEPSRRCSTTVASSRPASASAGVDASAITSASSGIDTAVWVGRAIRLDSPSASSLALVSPVSFAASPPLSGTGEKDRCQKGESYREGLFEEEFLVHGGSSKWAFSVGRLRFGSFRGSQQVVCRGKALPRMDSESCCQPKPRRRVRRKRRKSGNHVSVHPGLSTPFPCVRCANSWIGALSPGC